MDSAEATLRTLGLELPDPPKALASYVPVQQVGELLYTSGVIPSWNGEVQFHGVVGGDVSLKDASRAAEICALNIMALHSDKSAILSAVIFNALIIIALIPLALKGVAYRPVCAAAR